MIVNRLAKEASPKDLLVQFSHHSFPKVFEEFEKVLQREGFITRKAPIMANVINFYTVSERRTKQYGGTKLIKAPAAFSFEKKVVYLNEKELEEIGLEIDPTDSTLIIREAMEHRFSIDYEIQETLSEKQSVVFLCALSGAIVNCQYAKEIQFYDQRSDQMAHRHENSVLSNVWMNMLYQIPGLGKQKCRDIAKSYPTYSSIVEDSEGLNKLRKVQVGRGLASANLGSIMANRIYKVMTSVKGNQNIL